MRKVITVLLIGAVAVAAFAQETDEQKKTRKTLRSLKMGTFQSEGTSVEIVLPQLMGIAQVKFLIDQDCCKGLKASVAVNDATIEEILKIILEPHKLDYIIRKDGTVFISTSKRIAQMREKKKDSGLKAGEILFLLKDGSKIKGTVTVEKWKLKTAYGLLEIPTNEIRKIRFFSTPHEAKEGEEAPAEDEVETVRFTVTGNLEIEKLEVDTGKGKLAIPKSDIKEILFPKAAAVKPLKEEILIRIKADFKVMEDAIQFFRMDTQRYPQNLNELVVGAGIGGWQGPYLKNPATDLWGHPYKYEYTGEEPLPYEIKTLGADGIEGGDGENKDHSNLDFLKEK